MTFSVSAKGDNLTYQWQVKVVGSSEWVVTSLSGNKTDTLSVTAQEAWNGRQYRCAVSDGTTTVYSNPATMTVTTN